MFDYLFDSLPIDTDLSSSVDALSDLLGLGTEDPIDPIDPIDDDPIDDDPIDPIDDPDDPDDDEEDDTKENDDDNANDEDVLVSDNDFTLGTENVGAEDDSAISGIIGDPEAALESWHQQEDQNSCAVAAQEFVLEALTGEEFNEADLAYIAEANGWYTPEGGTPCTDVGNLLLIHGMEVVTHFDADFDDIVECLDNGGEVIVAVDAFEIWNGANNDWFGPGEDANHAVHVAGIDMTNPDAPVVILNDSGAANGQGLEVPLDLFMEAWEDSSCFLIEAYNPTNQ